ncbi:MAG TPA: sulfatase [Membranihabitans sp.]|nr:sulfatase [Membranihabitans sp.]
MCPLAMSQNPDVAPNFLFIAIDDLNDWIGVLHGHPQVRTPNIDKLAERGFLFSNAHTQAPLCNPSRTSVLTGLRPESTGIYGLAPRYRSLESMNHVVSLPQYLSQHDYHTISGGKILHGGITPEERANDFEEWGPDGGFGPYPEEKIVRKKLDMIDHPLVDWGPFPRDSDTSILDYKLATWASDRLFKLSREEREQPFFLAVGFHKPHVPLYVSERWFDLYPGDAIVLPPAPDYDRMDVPDFAWYLHWFLPEPRLSWLINNNEWVAKVRAYLACISFVDAQVGRVLDALEESGLADHTIVILWSDHGYHLGEKGVTGKNTLWEPSTHVPLIFSGPGIPAGESSGEAVELLDMFPTILDLAGIQTISQLQGVSLKPFFDNPEYERDIPAITTHNPGNHSIRNSKWRYISYADGSEELYDMQRDPYEWKNLADVVEYDSIRNEMKKWVPSRSESLAPGSRHRTLEKRGEDWFWENEIIDFGMLID